MIRSTSERVASALAHARAARREAARPGTQATMDDALALGGAAVLENLKEMRARIKTRKGKQARRIRGWSFAQLRSFVASKAEQCGLTVAGVDPRLEAL